MFEVLFRVFLIASGPLIAAGMVIEAINERWWRRRR